MRLLCVLVGHKPPDYSPNYGGDYGTMHDRGFDGIGRHHVALRGECPRCGENYWVMKAHVPNTIKREKFDER